jgi:hypothetical protein
MRILLAATMAASVLAIGSSIAPAASVPAGSRAGDAGTPVHRTQQKEQQKEVSPGPGTGGDRMRSGERGSREDRLRMGQPRGYIDGDREWRRGDREWRGRGRRGWGGRPGYGHRTDCGWLRRRALDTGSRYWWRQWRECVR